MVNYCMSDQLMKTITIKKWGLKRPFKLYEFGISWRPKTLIFNSFYFWLLISPTII